MNRIGDLAQRDAVSHRQGVLPDHLPGMGPEDVHPQNFSRQTFRHHLDHARGFGFRDRTVNL